MQKIRDYAVALGVSPTTVVQRAGRMSGGSWAKWEAGKGSPTLRKADEILQYIKDNPAPDAGAEPMKAAG